MYNGDKHLNKTIFFGTVFFYSHKIYLSLCGWKQIEGTWTRDIKEIQTVCYTGKEDTYHESKSHDTVRVVEQWKKTVCADLLYVIKVYSFSVEERMQTFNEYEKVIYQISHFLHNTRMLRKSYTETNIPVRKNNKKSSSRTSPKGIWETGYD